MDEHTRAPGGPGGGGAVAQLVRDDVERKRFLKMAGRTIGAAAAASGLAAFVAACGSSSSKTTSTATTSVDDAGDLAIVNYALTLEYLEDQFYSDVAASGLFKGATLATLERFGAEEHDHVLALHGTASQLGTPAAKPVGSFPLTSAASVTKLAGSVENLGAAAYLGQAGNIKSREILATALAIHTVEARHAATINTLLGLSTTPDGPFAVPMSMDQVLAVVKPFIA